MSVRVVLLLLLASLNGCDMPRPASPAVPEGLTGRVVSTADGDSFTLRTADGTRHRVRLFGIDAPERGQPYSNKARQALEAKTWEREIVVVEREKDGYGRVVANVFVEGRQINVELVEEGWAWHYKRHSSDGDLAAAEVAARRDRRGLWADEDAMPPWEWRRRNPGDGSR